MYKISELYYITPISNITSIMKHGILSHNQADKIEHISIAMPEIQQRRVQKSVPGGRVLHDYVNLYFCARNPMLYKRKEHHKELCILRINHLIFQLPGTIITDGNAASDYTRFWSYPEGLNNVDWETVFAEYWTDSDQIKKWYKTRVKCAEVLVPDRIAQYYIQGIYVSCDETNLVLKSLNISFPIQKNSYLFFK